MLFVLEMNSYLFWLGHCRFEVNANGRIEIIFLTNVGRVWMNMYRTQLDFKTNGISQDQSWSGIKDMV